MHKKLAFSLWELLVCLSILMILSTLAYPIYTQHLRRSYRQQAEIQLMRLAQELEIHHAKYHDYQGFKSLPVNAHYEIEISDASENDYLIQAIPKAEQDRFCGTLSLSKTGKRGISGHGDLKTCWPSA